MSEHSSVAAERQRTLEGERLARGIRVAIVAARFNDFIVEPLLSAAVELLYKHGADQGAIKVLHVPGAFELPLAAQKLAQSGRYDALIALGAVIRGDTPHFDYVAGECAAGLQRVSLDTGVPVIFGVLTTNTVEQATDRAGGKHGNKGADAALTAIEMVALLRSLDT
jgi:6,7-dimethyl-8-ribityllumazine synthase